MDNEAHERAKAAAQDMKNNGISALNAVKKHKTSLGSLYKYKRLTAKAQKPKPKKSEPRLQTIQIPSSHKVMCFFLTISQLKDFIND